MTIYAQKTDGIANTRDEYLDWLTQSSDTDLRLRPPVVPRNTHPRLHPPLRMRAPDEAETNQPRNAGRIGCVPSSEQRCNAQR